MNAGVGSDRQSGLGGRPAVGLGAAFAVAAVWFVYRGAVRSYFFNDDFQWLQAARQFNLGKLWHIDQYDHFYRPVIEIYFYLGRHFYGCAAWPFHITSVVIHLLNTWLLYAFARSLGGRTFGVMSALLFVAQPGYVEAVVWVGAITDLLPAFWYLLTLWLYLRFLRGGSRHLLLYAGTLATFTACLLTHESSVTLLAMILALEFTVRSDDGLPAGAVLRSMARSAAKYVPFLLLLAGYLAIEYGVSSRSYLIRERHYAFGWHAVPHVLQYIVSLYVGKHGLMSYVAIGVLAGLGLAFGGGRVRFFVAWVVVTLLPPAFFTWGNTSRYLYLPAAGGAMLVAHALLSGKALVERWWPRGTAALLTGALLAIVAVRFAVFARLAADGVAERTRPYEHLAAVVNAAAAAGGDPGVVVAEAADVEGVPELYRDVAAQAADCTGERHVIVR